MLTIRSFNHRTKRAAILRTLTVDTVQSRDGGGLLISGSVDSETVTLDFDPDDAKRLGLWIRRLGI